MSQDGGISLMMGHPFQMNSSSVGGHVCHVNKQLSSYSAPQITEYEYSATNCEEIN